MNTKKGLTSRERLNQNNKRIFDLQSQNDKLSPDDRRAAVNKKEIIELQQENADAVSKNPELNFVDMKKIRAAQQKAQIEAITPKDDVEKKEWR